MVQQMLKPNHPPFHLLVLEVLQYEKKYNEPLIGSSLTLMI